MTRFPGIPENYELERVGIPTPGELYVYGLNEVRVATPEDVAFISDSYPVAIVFELKRWRRARRDMAPRLPIVAQFRNSDDEQWTSGMLVDWAYGTHRHKDANGKYWRHCRVFY